MKVSTFKLNKLGRISGEISILLWKGPGMMNQTAEHKGEKTAICDSHRFMTLRLSHTTWFFGWIPFNLKFCSFLLGVWSSYCRQKEADSQQRISKLSQVWQIESKRITDVHNVSCCYNYIFTAHTTTIHQTCCFYFRGLQWKRRKDCTLIISLPWFTEIVHDKLLCEFHLVLRDRYSLSFH